MQDSTSEISQVKHSLTKNRSEHLGKDVWSDFVIPRFFNRVPLISTMPIRLEGGRGSGKTMLLRYLSYHSQFSDDRKNLPDNAADSVGLYWKADTQFLRIMQKRGLSDEEWSPVFDHYLNLRLGLEVLSSIRLVANSAYAGVSKDSLVNVFFEGALDFGFENTSFEGVLKEIGSRIRKTDTIIQNVSGIENLEKLPVSFLHYLVESSKEQIPGLEKTVFSVYIDEYENLLNYQQRIINTRIKHSEPPLIFNIAIKLNGMSETQTLSDERLENKADYAIVNLDAEIERSGFDDFVSEIFLKKLSEASPTIAKELKIDLKACSNPDNLEYRFSDDYRRHCREIVEGVFPGRSHQDLADEIFETSRYYKKLTTEIERALLLRHSSLKAEDFILQNHRKASIVCSSLLYRRNLDPAKIKAELDKLEGNTDNKFNNKTAWEHNNFIGCYLRIIRSHKAGSTFYSGFDVYSALSGKNVRHFLELCKSAFSLLDDSTLTEKFIIDRPLQHIAAKNTSDELVKEITRFTPLGSQLSNFVKALGRIFQLCQDKETQSETEVTHFGIREDDSPLTEEDDKFFKEAEKWGVLQAIESTKNKSSASAAIYDYVLNPVYSPFFLISYRKGRKIEIDSSTIRQMYLLGEAAITKEVRKKMRLSGLEDSTAQPKQATLL
ncbi:ORC-CDC6 family AAA ATPase [Pseudomonas inefficax]|uniref:ORC-CDC6 family AAA ATPase n=1 Tax=Pseudomonas inefficax TaxID=2078786 RepID=UPI004046BA37